MICGSVFTGMIVTLGLYLLLVHQTCEAADTGPNTDHKSRNRVLARFPRPVNQYSRFRPETFNDFLGEFQKLEILMM